MAKLKACNLIVLVKRTHVRMPRMGSTQQRRGRLPTRSPALQLSQSRCPYTWIYLPISKQNPKVLISRLASSAFVLEVLLEQRILVSSGPRNTDIFSPAA